MLKIEPNVVLELVLDENTPSVYRKYKRAMGGEEVEKFMANALHDQLLDLQASNREKLFRACEVVGIREIFVGERELVTCHKEGCNNRPAVWVANEMLNGGRFSGDGVGFSAGCGNGSQTQTNDNEKWFGDGFVLRAYDVETRERIPYPPFRDNMVVTHKFKLRG